nr:Putative ammonia monooxygenase [Klebsiella pneumoniae]
MLLPMLLGALAQGGGWLMLELPEWLLAMAYAVLGWTVGLQFNKAIFCWPSRRCRRLSPPSSD